MPLLWSSAAKETRAENGSITDTYLVHAIPRTIIGFPPYWTWRGREEEPSYEMTDNTHSNQQKTLGILADREMVSYLCVCLCYVGSTCGSERTFCHSLLLRPFQMNYFTCLPCSFSSCYPRPSREQRLIHPPRTNSEYWVQTVFPISHAGKCDVRPKI